MYINDLCTCRFTCIYIDIYTYVYVNIYIYIYIHIYILYICFVKHHHLIPGGVPKGFVAAEGFESSSGAAVSSGHYKESGDRTEAEDVNIWAWELDNCWVFSRRLASKSWRPDSCGAAKSLQLRRQSICGGSHGWIVSGTSRKRMAHVHREIEQDEWELPDGLRMELMARSMKLEELRAYTMLSGS